jgi:hypothetical protein
VRTFRPEPATFKWMVDGKLIKALKYKSDELLVICSWAADS